MFVSFEGFVAFEVIALLTRPQFNSHIFRAAHQIFPIWMKVDIVYHSSVFPQRLFTFTCLIVPYFDRSIFTRGRNLSVNRMKSNLRYFRFMPSQLQLFWLSWDCVTHIFSFFFVHGTSVNCASLDDYATFHAVELFFVILKINIILFIRLLKLLTLSLKIHDLFL